MAGVCIDKRGWRFYTLIMDQIKRKPNRLKNYDYSQNGIYFITICTNNRKPVLSQIFVGAGIARPHALQLTNIGLVAEKGIKGIEKHHENMFIDHYVIMPNHVHLLLRIERPGGRAMLAPTVSRIVQQLKGYVSKQSGKKVWQKSFYDHVIRDEQDYFTKWQYIDENPLKWCEDELYQQSFI